MEDKRRHTDDVDFSNVPTWVIRLVQDTAATKVQVESISQGIVQLAGQLEHFVTRREFDGLNGQVSNLASTRINPLWDEMNTLKGEQKAERKTASRWRYVLTTAIALLGVLVLINWTGLHIRLGS